MDLNVSLNQNKTYNNTIKDSISWTKAQDSALESVSTSMLRIRSLVQSSANATAGSEELGANRSEIEQEIAGIVESLNTNFDGTITINCKSLHNFTWVAVTPHSNSNFKIQVQMCLAAAAAAAAAFSPFFSSSLWLPILMRYGTSTEPTSRPRG